MPCRAVGPTGKEGRWVLILRAGRGGAGVKELRCTGRGRKGREAISDQARRRRCNRVWQEKEGAGIGKDVLCTLRVLHRRAPRSHE